MQKPFVRLVLVGSVFGLVATGCKCDCKDADKSGGGVAQPRGDTVMISTAGDSAMIAVAGDSARVAAVSASIKAGKFVVIPK